MDLSFCPQIRSSVPLLVLQEVHQSAGIHSNSQVLYSICALEDDVTEVRKAMYYESSEDLWKGVHLACPDQFMVPELGQLSPQSQIRVHQERLSTTLVEILEGKSCTHHKKCISNAI